VSKSERISSRTAMLRLFVPVAIPLGDESSWARSAKEIPDIKMWIDMIYDIEVVRRNRRPENNATTDS
jgi:hypothetical protein